MKVGFGAYRISTRSSEHKEALAAALESGCSVIDTSANYTDGESERLIGEVLKETGKTPLVITKAGYVQGQNIQRLEKLKELNPNIEFVDHHEGLKHSIDPIFLKDQIEQSLERMNLDCLDAVLLHNPEYFLKDNPEAKDEYYLRIQKAFKFLNTQVEAGVIKAFGISSNSFVDAIDSKEYTDIDLVWKAAEAAGAQLNFKYIQFPMNLIEMGAVEARFDGLNLIQKAQGLGLTTIANRPLNAFSSSGLVRLAVSPVDESLVANASSVYEKAMTSLNKQWEKAKESEEDKLEDIPLLKQISQIWNKQISKDAVEQIFYGHFFQLVAGIYGKDLSPEESAPYYELFETALECAKNNMNERAKSFMAQAQESGLIPPSDETIAVRVLEKYAETGVDIVLVGMRSKAYVEGLKRFF